MDEYQLGYIQGREDAVKELIAKMKEFDLMNGFTNVLIDVVRGTDES